jgi:hypothetical protein
MNHRYASTEFDEKKSAITAYTPCRILTVSNIDQDYLFFLGFATLFHFSH